MKKWSYATAVMLSLAGGTIMTGCIDNDEPYGIEQIRVATADFLKSQVALNEAKAKTEAANAEIAKIKAEIEKTNAEIAKMQAESAIKIAEAEAEAKLAQTKAEAEAAQAKADMLKAQVQAYIDGMNAKIDRFIKETEDAARNAQLAYDKAVYQWEQQKIQDAANYQNALYTATAEAYDAYLGELKNFNALNDELIAAQKNFAQYANNLIWDGTGFVHVLSDQQLKVLNNAIESAEQEIADCNKNLEYLNEVKTTLETLNGSDLYKLYLGYKDQVNTNKENIAKAEIEKAQIELKNQPLLAEIQNLLGAWNDAKAKEVALPAVELPGNTALAGFESKVTVVAKNQKFSFNNPANYNTALANINTTAAQLNMLTVGPDQEAWSQAALNEMERLLPPYQKASDAAIEVWENAKKVYNNGKDADASVAPEAANVAAALAAFNGTMDAYLEANGKVQAAKEAAKTANKAATDAFKALATTDNAAKEQAARDEYDDAIAENAKAYKTATDEAEALYASTMKTYDDQVTVAEGNRDAAQKNVDKAQAAVNDNPLNAALGTILAQAQTELANAEAALLKAQALMDGAEVKAAAARDKATQQAAAIQLSADIAAQKVLQAALNEIALNGGTSQDTDPAWIAYRDLLAKANTAQNNADALEVALQDASKDPKKAILAAQTKLGQAVEKQRKALLGTAPWASYSSPNLTDFFNDPKASNWPATVAPLDEKVNGVYVNAKEYVSVASQAAFGQLDTDALTSVENAKAQIDAQIERDNQGTPSYLLYTFYQGYGAYGKLLYANADIAHAKDVLSTNGVIAQWQKLLADNKAAIEKLKADNDAAVKAAEKAYNAKNDEYNGLFAAINNQIAAYNNENRMLNNILGVINTNFATAEGVIPSGSLDAASLEAARKAIDQYIETANKKLADAQKALAHAQKDLELYQNGKAEYDTNPYASQVELLTAQVEIAKQELELHKAQLDELQAKYEASCKK